MSEGDDEGQESAGDATEDWPRRLVAAPDREGEFVRRFLRQRPDGSEERAWQRLAQACADGANGELGWRAPGRRRRAFLATVAGAGALAMFVLVATRPSHPSTTAVTRLATSAPREDSTPAKRKSEVGSRSASGLVLGPVATSAPREDSAPDKSKSEVATRSASGIVLGAVAQALGPGHWTIKDEASGEVTKGAIARAELGLGGAPTVTLLSGQVSLSVVHKERPAQFRVVSPPFTFTVLGTVFRVERRPNDIALVVIEGRVAVARSGRQLATVTGGETWSGRLASAATLGKESGSHAPDAAALTCGPGAPVRERLACLRTHANGEGLSAETAQYELAKLTRDELHDPAGALAALEELRRRFPRGALRVETDLSIVELLPSVGRYREALDASAALLAQGGTGEQQTELHLLRGNIYREALGDLTRAVNEYRLAAEHASRRPSADEAAFLYAVATEALGHHDAAVELFRRYLARPQPAHESEARARLDSSAQRSSATK